MITAVVLMDFHPSVEFDGYIVSIALSPFGGYLIKRQVGNWVAKRRFQLQNSLSYRYGCREMFSAFQK